LRTVLPSTTPHAPLPRGFAPHTTPHRMACLAALRLLRTLPNRYRWDCFFRTTQGFTRTRDICLRCLRCCAAHAFAFARTGRALHAHAPAHCTCHSLHLPWFPLPAHRAPHAPPTCPCRTTPCQRAVLPHYLLCHRACPPSCHAPPRISAALPAGFTPPPYYLPLPHCLFYTLLPIARLCTYLQHCTLQHCIPHHSIPAALPGTAFTICCLQFLWTAATTLPPLPFVHFATHCHCLLLPPTTYHTPAFCLPAVHCLLPGLLHAFLPHAIALLASLCVTLPFLPTYSVVPPTSIHLTHTTSYPTHYTHTPPLLHCHLYLLISSLDYHTLHTHGSILVPPLPATTPLPLGFTHMPSVGTQPHTPLLHQHLTFCAFLPHTHTPTLPTPHTATPGPPTLCEPLPLQWDTSPYLPGLITHRTFVYTFPTHHYLPTHTHPPSTLTHTDSHTL